MKSWGCCDNIDLDDTRSVDCVMCKLYFHLSCVWAPGFEPEYASLADWKCPACVSNIPKGTRHDSTPVRNVTTVRGNKRPALNSPPTPAAAVTAEDVRTIVQTLLKQELENTVKEITSSLSKTIADHLEPIKAEIKEMKQSMDFMSSQFDDMEVEIGNAKKKMAEMETENRNLKSTVADLTQHINNLEQQSRTNNLEIQCVPENRKENLYTIINNLAQTVGCDINSSITNCTRIAKQNTESARPRSIVVQLASPRARDALLAAVLKFNKANPQDKLNCAHLGFSGITSSVFVVEHLSPANKKLHAAARHAAKDKGFKYVWVRNGRIFIRKTDESEVIYIKNIEILNKLN
ncbi:uncharacterized protein LOC134805444 [Cydia splendana]|uniref:uncharacterized protein LOC134805444 n=1 Tax=Cydia splendana TaxID=1100963 RepID=UPI00300D8009